MDIFAELEKLRMEHANCDDPRCGANKHNETLDGVIEWLKSLDMAHGLCKNYQRCERIKNEKI